jgi:hypothetical protein
MLVYHREKEDETTMQIRYFNVLAANLDFDDHDLAENRAGHLSEKQAAKLKLLRKKENRDVITFMLVMLLVCGPLTLVLVMNSIDIFGWICGGLYLCILGVGPVFWYLSHRAITADLNAGRIEAVQGPIQCYEHVVNTKNAHIIYSVRIGDVKFNRVTQEVYTAFRHLEVYTVYYTPHSKHLLAAEAMA